MMAGRMASTDDRRAATPSLHIAFLTEHASPLALRGGTDAGGQNVYVDEVARGLGRLGHRVDIFTRRDNANLPEIVDLAPGVRIVHLTAGPPDPLPKDDLWPLMPAFRDAFLAFARRDGARYDLIHGNFWMSGWVATEVRRDLGIPVVQIFHATGKTKRRHQGDADTSPEGRIAIEEAVVRDADRLIAQCPAEREELVDDYAADPARVATIPSAVNTQRFRPTDRDEARQRLGLDPHAPIVVYIGRILPRKDVRNVVRAVALLAHQVASPVQLLLVGGETIEPDPIATPEIGEVLRLAAELGIADRVICTGQRQPDELHWYYGAGDVAVTTPWYEPFGLTPLEGMACGRPVIGSAVGGITYTIADGLTGFLVPPRDPQALADRLRLLLAEPALRERMGRAARERVERGFTWDTVVERTAALYGELLAGAGVAGPRAVAERERLASVPAD
ncbi:MAG TPA: glycosyltransferase [Thermomicrobiales bacterium]|jgi:glycosyltransferase involved in cell wall biosynthesis